MNVNGTPDRRKFKRIKISNLSRIDNTDCTILNASKDGLLLAAQEQTDESKVKIQLKINGQWVDIDGDVMWSVIDPYSQHTSMGVFVTKAPAEYKELIENLYLEADEQD